jgi:hypothetical protein
MSTRLSLTRGARHRNRRMLIGSMEDLLNRPPRQVPNRRCGLLMIEELLAGSGVDC